MEKNYTDSYVAFLDILGFIPHFQIDAYGSVKVAHHLLAYRFERIIHDNL